MVAHILTTIPRKAADVYDCWRRRAGTASGGLLDAMCAGRTVKEEILCSKKQASWIAFVERDDRDDPNVWIGGC